MFWTGRAIPIRRGWSPRRRSPTTGDRSCARSAAPRRRRSTARWAARSGRAATMPPTYAVPTRARRMMAHAAGAASIRWGCSHDGDRRRRAQRVEAFPGRPRFRGTDGDPAGRRRAAGRGPCARWRDRRGAARRGARGGRGVWLR